jgi:hypothetical protein
MLDPASANILVRFSMKRMNTTMLDPASTKILVRIKRMNDVTFFEFGSDLSIYTVFSELKDLLP